MNFQPTPKSGTTGVRSGIEKLMLRITRKMDMDMMKSFLEKLAGQMEQMKAEMKTGQEEMKTGQEEIGVRQEELKKDIVSVKDEFSNVIQEKMNAMEEKVVENKVLEMDKDLDKKVHENIEAEVWKIEENFEKASDSVKEEIKGLK